jgi:flagellar hook-associated protein FlgK
MHLDIQVKLDTEHLKRVEAEHLLNKTQNESTMSDVFAKYEYDMGRLRSENKELLVHNQQLLRQIQTLAVSVAGKDIDEGAARLCEQCGKRPGVCPYSLEMSVSVVCFDP